MKEHHISIKKSARYYVQGEINSNTRHLWIVCHGYGYLAGRFIKQLDSLAGKDTVVVCPEGLHRFYMNGMDGKVGASWMTKEDRLSDIKDYVAFMELLYSELMKQVDTDSVTINVLGFSQGTATVCRWLANGKSKVNNLILWGGAIPSDLDFTNAAPILNALNIKLVVGRKDEFIKEEDIEEHQGFLNENFIKFELIRYDGGHQLDSQTLLSISLK